jgi:hypothetical protein
MATLVASIVATSRRSRGPGRMRAAANSAVPAAHAVAATPAATAHPDPIFDPGRPPPVDNGLKASDRAG